MASVGKMTSWQRMQAWRSVRQDMVQRYLSEGAAIASSLTNAWTANIKGQYTLATKVASKRIAAEAQQKITEAQKALGSIDKVV